jgi:hypothetical protein
MTAKFAYPQPITPAQWESLKEALAHQGAEISGPDSALSIANFHGIDALASYDPPTGQLVITVTGTHGLLAHLASAATIEEHINAAIAEALAAPAGSSETADEATAPTKGKPPWKKK